MRAALIAAGIFTLTSLAASASIGDNILRRETGTVTYQLPQNDAISLVGAVSVADAVVTSTSQKSLAKLQLRDSSEIRIGDRTTVRIGDLTGAAAATPGGTIYLERGAVRFAIAHPQGGKANYRFVTPTSTVGVRGTIGYFVVGPAGQQLYCVKCEAGDVQVTAANKTVEVLTGQSLDLTVRNGAVTSSEIVSNRSINNPAIDQFLGGRSPFGDLATEGTDFTQSGSGAI